MKTFLSRSMALLIVIFVILFVVTTAISSNATDPALEKSYPQVGIQKCWEAYDKVVFPLGWMQSQWEDWQIENVETATGSEITIAVMFPLLTLALLTTLVIVLPVLLYRFVGFMANLFAPVANPQTNEQKQSQSRGDEGEAAAPTPTPGGPRITWPAVGLVAVLAVIAIGAVFLSRESIWLPQVIHRQAERVGEPMEVLINNRLAIGGLRAMAAEIKSGGSVSEKELQAALQNASTSLAELEVLQAAMTVTPTAGISVTAPASISLSTISAAISETEMVLQRVASPEDIKIRSHRTLWQRTWSWLRWVFLIGAILLVAGIVFGVIQFQGSGPAATGRYPRTQC